MHCSRWWLFINFVLLVVSLPIAQSFSVPSSRQSSSSSLSTSTTSTTTTTTTTTTHDGSSSSNTKGRNDNNNKNNELLYKTNLRSKIVGSIAKGERRAKERSAALRPVCLQCERPNTLCVCHVLLPPRRRDDDDDANNKNNNNNKLKKFDTKTTILILQHPNERRKKNLSTVPLLKLALKNVHVKVGYTFDPDDDSLPPFVKELFKKGGQKPLLLYPSPDAISLDDDDDDVVQSSRDNIVPSANNNKISAADLIKKQQNNLLIIMDGTWTEAKRMVRDSPKLVNCCQAVQFTSEASSIYDALRSEPEAHCLSTLEACARALVLLEQQDQQPTDVSTTTTTTTTTLMKGNCSSEPQQQQAHQQQVNIIQESLHKLLQAHVDAHLANARIMAPRYVGASKHKLSDKNQRRKEIESTFLLLNGDDDAPPSTAAAVADSSTRRRRQEVDEQGVSSRVASHQHQQQQSQNQNDWLEQQQQQQDTIIPPFVWQRLPDGAILRSLQTSDAELVDSWWEYRSSKSLPLVRRRINLDLLQQQHQQQQQNHNGTTTTTAHIGGGGGGCCCLGIEVNNNQLVACIMRYEGGALGMLYVEERYRRRGYGKVLLEQATRILQQSGEERVAFIVDGNHASEGLFSSVGWERADPNRKRKTGKRRAKRKWIHTSIIKNKNK